ncbi:MAG: RepB family plasmid replication initiator protein [Sphingobacteriaceae bacterium]|nr:MAG: RepB family plasmid replication initiator protein [Sphingobacteriaceae bacterium]
MLTNTENTTVTLSNDFIQQPQAPFSTVETKLFHAVLLQIHQRDTAFKDSYSILITDIIERKGRNYALLAEAIISLKNRIWFGEHLFLALHHIKNEGVIEFVLNPNLTEHLLCKNGWFASIDVADLYQRGLTHATAWRLLWLLRSWYRPLMKVKEKKLTIAELSNYFFGGDKAFDTFGSLKQHFQYAEKALAMVNDYPFGVVRYFPEYGYIPGYVANKSALIEEQKGEILSIIGKIYVAQKKYDLAEETLKKAMMLSRNIAVYHNLAYLYEQTKQPKLAFDAYRKILLQMPYDS